MKKSTQNKAAKEALILFDANKSRGTKQALNSVTAFCEGFGIDVNNEKSPVYFFLLMNQLCFKLHGGKYEYRNV